MTILDTRNYYKPFDYPWAYDLYKKQAHEMHWNPDEITFTTDLDHFNKLAPAEQEFIRNIFTFFTQADVDVANVYVQRYLPWFQKPELRMMLGAFNNMESNHQQAYARLMEALGFEDFQNFLEYPEMIDKHEYIKNTDGLGIPGLMEDIAIGSAFGEGLQLFGSFVMLLSFADRGLMPNVRDVVFWSMRDETVHVEGLMKIFKTLREEFPVYWTDEVKRTIYESCRKMVELEDRFIGLIYPDHLTLPNLPKEHLHRYIRYLADHRLGQLGLKPNYYVDDHPISWLGQFSNQLHEDLFNDTGTNYDFIPFNSEDMFS